MTNEEAIKEIQLTQCEGCSGLFCKNGCIFDVSIKALESIDKLKAERDAAISDLLFLKENPYSTFCNICKNIDNEEKCDKCNDSLEIDFPFFEWRGYKNE